MFHKESQPSSRETQTSGKLVIRPSTNPDCPKIVQMMIENFEGPAYSLYPQDVIDAYKAANNKTEMYHALRSGGTEAFVAETQRGEIAGFVLIRYNPDRFPRRNAYGELDLRRLHVNPKTQGEGVGKTLFEFIEQSARELNVEFITTHASGSSRPYFEQNGWTGKTILHKMDRRKTSSLVFAAQKRVTQEEIILFQTVTHVVYAGSNTTKADHLRKIVDILHTPVIQVAAEEAPTADAVESARSKALSVSSKLTLRKHSPLVVANDVRTDLMGMHPERNDARYYLVNRGKPERLEQARENFMLLLTYSRRTKKPAPYVVRSATYLHTPLEPDLDSYVENDVLVHLNQEGLEQLSSPVGFNRYREEVRETYGIDPSDMSAGFALPVFLNHGWVAGLFGHPFDTLPREKETIERALTLTINGIDEKSVRERLGYLK